jgi:hypothetical protein
MTAPFVIAGFGWIMWMGPSTIVRVGAGMVIAGTIFVVWRLRTRGAASALPTDLGLKNALEFHRAELVRQRDLLRSVWLWYLLPLVPGMFVAQIGRALAYPEKTTGIVIYCGVILATALGGHELNRRAAARIQERIDRLTDNP